ARSASATDAACAGSPRTFHAIASRTSASATQASPAEGVRVAACGESDTQPLPVRIDESRRAQRDLYPRAGEECVALAEVRLAIAWNVRGDSAQAAFVAEAERALGM